MTTSRLGAYSFIISSILLFISGFLPDGIDKLGNILSIFGFCGIIYSTYALCAYFRKEDKDNALLTLVPILAIVGWSANAFGSAIRLPLSDTNIESVNAVASIGGSLSATGGLSGFIGTALIGFYVFKKTSFSTNNIYKIITILFVIASIAMLVMVSVFPLLVDGGREVATAVGEPGDVILTISTSILFPIWMISMSIITIWSIVTGFIFLKKD